MRLFLSFLMLPFFALVFYGFARWLSWLIARFIPLRWHRFLFRDYITGELKLPRGAGSRNHRA